MRVWIDLSNSPHVALFEPIVTAFRSRGWDVVLTARDHGQTAALAVQRWDDVVVVGGESPSGLAVKAYGIAARAAALRSFARQTRPDIALSHASYAHIVAARVAGVPAVNMMDYEHQPANHLSFRAANRVIVPRLFPASALRRFGARSAKVVRYDGFKEELYLAEFRPDRMVLGELGLDRQRIIAVFRSGAEGALYHRDVNRRFEDLLELARTRDDVQVVHLPRTRAQAERARRLDGVIVPKVPIDGRSLLAYSDLMLGGGGTMTRESALLGTPTYTVFPGRLAAVDAALIEAGLLHDLRDPVSTPRFEKKAAGAVSVSSERASAILRIVVQTVADVASLSRRAVTRLRR